MTKLLLALGISLGLLNALFAQELDFISLATKGKFNEKSEGVKILNDEEMSKVVGGIVHIYTHFYGLNPAMYSEYYRFQKKDFDGLSNQQVFAMFKEASFYLNRGETAILYAKRFYHGQVEWTWLAGYNPSTGQARDLGLSASMKLFQFIDSQHKYSHY